MKKISVTPVANPKLEDEIKKKFALFQLPNKGLNNFEQAALQLGLILNSSNPEIKRPTLLFFTADHGFIASPKSFKVDSLPTAEKVYQVLNKTSLSSKFTKTHRIHVKVADLGVDHSFEGSLDFWLNRGSRFIPIKIAHGTRNFEHFPAMTTEQCYNAIQGGTELIKTEKRRECNTIGFTTISRGGDISAKILAYTLLRIGYNGIEENEGKATANWIEKVLKKHPKTHDPITLLTLYGGFEIAAMVGAYMQAASLKMAILVDGFSSSVALLIASLQKPEVLDYCFFGTGAKQHIHQLVLTKLKAKPLISNEMDTSEGLSFALSYPMLKNASILLRDTD